MHKPLLANNQFHSTLGDFLKHFIPIKSQKSLAMNLHHNILVKMYSTETDILKILDSIQKRSGICFVPAKKGPVCKKSFKDSGNKLHRTHYQTPCNDRFSP